MATLRKSWACRSGFMAHPPQITAGRNARCTLTAQWSPLEQMQHKEQQLLYVLYQWVHSNLQRIDWRFFHLQMDNSIRLNEISGRFLRRVFCCLTEPIQKIIKKWRLLDSPPEQRNLLSMPEQKEDSWGVLSPNCSTHQAQSLNAQVPICRKESPWFARDAVLCAKGSGYPSRTWNNTGFCKLIRGKIILWRASLSLWTRAKKHNISPTTGRNRGKKRTQTGLVAGTTWVPTLPQYLSAISALNTPTSIFWPITQ